MADHFEDQFRDLKAPATGAFAITPGPDEFAQVTRGVWVGADGNMTVTMKDGQTVTFVAVKAGSLLPFRIRKCTAATATDLVGVY